MKHWKYRPFVLLLVFILCACAAIPAVMATSTKVTALTIKVPVSAFVKNQFDITGKLTGGPTGVGVSDKQITLSKSTDGKRWTTIGLVWTDAGGYYTLTTRESTDGKYKYKASFAGDKIFKAVTSPTASVSVTHVPSKITFEGIFFWENFPDCPNCWLPHGILTDDQGNGLGGKMVTLLYSSDSKTWSPVPSEKMWPSANPFTTASTAGMPEAGWTNNFLKSPLQEGYYKYSFAGDDLYAPSESNVVEGKRLATKITFEGIILWGTQDCPNCWLPHGILADGQGNGLGGKMVTLLYSSDSKTWSPVPSEKMWPSANPFITAGAPEAGWTNNWLVPPLQEGYYKYSFAGDDLYAPSESNSLPWPTG
jgi:hypothetical protein